MKKTILRIALGLALCAGLIISQAGQKTANFSVTVVDPADYAIAVTPATLTVVRGQSAQFTVTTTATGGYEGQIDLTLAGLPAGTFSFGASRIAVGSGTTITINSTLPTGAYNATLTTTEVVDQPPFNTVEAASAGSADIQAAIDAAQDGWTVEVPAGSAAWTSNVTIPATKGIRLIGAGGGATNVTLGSYILAVNTRAGNSPVRVSGFRFINNPSGALTINPGYAVGAMDWRIDHCEWTGTTATDTKLNIYGYTAGVVDNCSFINQGRTFVVDGRVAGDASATTVNGEYSWKHPVTMGGAELPYIEDCTFTQSTSAILSNAGAGARFVFRHNTVTGPTGMETHSGCTNGFRNPRWIEIYENTFTTGGTYWMGLFIRSTNGVIFNNALSGYQAMCRFDMETICRTDCNGPWGSANRTAYPAQDQIGAGMDGGFGTAQRTDEAKLWIWGNTLNGNATTPAFSGCDGATALVQLGRDYFLSAPPAYAPYAYPHPLRAK